MFGKVLSVVLSTLGVTAFAKDEEGKSILSEEQRKQLLDKYGEKFLEKFENDLKEFEKEGVSAESAITTEINAELQAELEENKKFLEEGRQMIAQLAEEKEALMATIEKLEKQETIDNSETLENKNGMEEKIGFKMDMNLAHNAYIDAKFKGAAYSGNSTIETSELQSEFGKYVSNEKMEIIKKLTGTTESTQYMSTVVSDKTEIRASSAAIDSVLQQFVPKWTPKGRSTFTPLTIKNYKLKINVPITPSDIMEDVLGYLYDEKLEPKDMPIVKYVLEHLIFPKLAEERELALAVGKFVESTATNDGEAGGDAQACMNGYLTQLVELRKANNTAVTWLLKDEQITAENILAQIDKAVDQVAPLYKKKAMFIHADPDMITLYGRAYRAQYPYTKNEDGEKVKVDFSRFSFVPMEGMRGTGAFFITPKENFKHIRSLDPQRAKVYMQAANYDVKVFAEWWEGCGFWIAEAIFAYIPATLFAESEEPEVDTPTGDEEPDTPTGGDENETPTGGDENEQGI